VARSACCGLYLKYPEVTKGRYDVTAFDQLLRTSPRAINFLGMCIMAAKDLTVEFSLAQTALNNLVLLIAISDSAEPVDSADFKPLKMDL
jgi:hypothetical protein